LQKQYESALPYCRQSLKIAESLSHDEQIVGLDVAHKLQALGINLYLAGQYSEADETLRKAYAQYIAFGQQLKNPQAASTYESQIEVLRWLERVLVAENRIAQALETAELGRSKALLATLSSGPEPPSVSSEVAVELARQHRSTIVEYSVLYDYDPDLLFLFSDFKDIPASSVYIWTIQPSGKIDFHESKIPTPGPTLPEMVEQFSSASATRNRSVTVTPVAAESAQPFDKLYSLLISPIAPDLPTDPNENVVFVLQDWLYLVPFAALRDDTGHYLIERHTLSVIPSLGVFQQIQQQSAKHDAGKGVLIVGNPIMPSVSLQEGQPAQQLSALPGAEQEARLVAAQFHATPLLGATATKERILSSLPNSEIAHFATHGLLDQKTGGFQSGVALSPGDADNGLLSAREIQHLKLNADLVVLSACNSALGKMSGDGIFGLSRSFLTAGVSSVVVSLWPISDDSTAFLMEHFYQHMRTGGDKSQALRSAMLDTKEKYSDPFHWAAFVLVGEPSLSSATRNAEGDSPVTSRPEAASDNLTFPLPQDVRDLTDDPDPVFNGETSVVRYSTRMSMADLMAFYKKTLASFGLKSESAIVNSELKSFSMVYRAWPDREAVVSAFDSGEAREVSLNFELRRDDDAEFSPSVNEAKAGISIPKHATGTDVRTKFDFSFQKGDVVFLSRSSISDLHAYYQKVLAHQGLEELPSKCESETDNLDCEYGAVQSKRNILLHIEKSFFHPERMEVHLEFSSPSN
jgi:CHAT domain-containing protein